MDLTDSYIRTLRGFLPRDQREDIIRELTEEIRAQVADREAALGRPLTTDEQTSVIGQYGHPMLLAARYRPQRHLVGPVLFPYYWLVLRVVVVLVIVSHVGSAIALLAGGAPWSEIGMVGEHLVQGVLAAGGWLTLLAAIVDRWMIRSRILENWDPRRILPRVHHAGLAVQHVEQAVGRHGPPMWSGHRMRPGQSSTMSGLVVGVVLSAWWLLSLKFPVLMLGGGATILDWAPAVDRVFPFLVLMQLLMLAEHFVRVIRPEHRRFFRLTRVLWIVGFPVFLYFLLTADHQWVVWRGAPDTHPQFDAVAVIAGRTLSLVDLINYMVSIALIVIAGAGVVSSLRALHRWYAGRGPSAVRV